MVRRVEERTMRKSGRPIERTRVETRDEDGRVVDVHYETPGPALGNLADLPWQGWLFLAAPWPWSCGAGLWRSPTTSCPAW